MKQNQFNTTIDIDALVLDAAKLIAPVWPMKTFIACNPLQGFEDHPFDVAFTQSSHEHITCEHEEIVNNEMIKWLSAFLDMGQATIEMPYREKGFYQSFCHLAALDPKLQDQKELQVLPNSPQEAILYCLKSFKIESKDYHSFLYQNLSYLSGWAGYVKWLSMWNNDEDIAKKFNINLVEFLAVRLLLTLAFWQNISLQPQKTISKKRIKQLEAIKSHEKLYADQLILKLAQSIQSQEIEALDTRSDMQMVFCIDVRSEPFRQALESRGRYETLGFAGFFGLPIRVYDYTQSKKQDCCPVLLKPRYHIHTEIQDGFKQKALYEHRLSVISSIVKAYQQLKYNYTTPFNLADAMGPWAGLGILMKNFSPKWLHQLQESLQQKWLPTVDFQLKTNHDKCDLGIPKADQVNYAETILKLMGLTKNFAKLVILCGHKSSTTNNPYASALDCGACGGNHGDNNAKILAFILNQADVREQLRQRGLNIPADTEFMAAVHDTTTDDCLLFEDPSSIHHELIQKIKDDLEIVKRQNYERRCQYFDDTRNIKSLNWSEVRPEWGLAKNAAFIVGPRKLTQNIPLEGRCFLHSYDWKIDTQGQLLETILTAPMVVAQWINSQYLFSTIDNVHFGSGSKVTQNVVGKFGVMQGNNSDLMHGLSLQSVKSSDKDDFHTPQRLLSVVYAPRERILNIIEKHEGLQKLVFNQWVHMVALDPTDQQFYRLNINHEWQKLPHTLENRDDLCKPRNHDCHQTS